MYLGVLEKVVDRYVVNKFVLNWIKYIILKIDKKNLNLIFRLRLYYV